MIPMPLPTERTTALALAAALRGQLSAGRWAPGAALRQADLAAEFGVSRIPVREALNQLQAEGLVVIEPNRGAFVPRHSPDDVDEIFDLRLALESDALRRAVPNHTPATIRRLEAIQRELDHATLPADWLRHDRDFHEALYAPCGRRRTLDLIAGLRRAVERVYAARLSPDSRRGSWNDEHQGLIEALRNGDAERAVRLLQTHLEQTRRLALSSLAGNSLENTAP